MEASAYLKYFPVMEDGTIPSAVSGVHYFWRSSYRRCEPVVYMAGIVFLFSGHKCLHFEDKVYIYDKNSYLVVSMMMPAICETCASADDPVAGIFVELDLAQLRELIGLMNIKDSKISLSFEKSSSPIGPSPMDEDMAQTLLRFLKVLNNR